MSTSARKPVSETNRVSSRLPRPILDFAVRSVKSLSEGKRTGGKRVERVGASVFKTLAERACEVDELMPEIEYLVYYGDMASDAHFRMWNPVFEKSGGRHVSIFRNPKAWYASLPAKNCFPLSTIRQVEPLLERFPNLKAIFYPANNGTNMQLVRTSGNLTNVFLGHGDSGKSSSAHKVFRLYDEVWVAGDAHIDRFSRAPGNYSSIKFRKVGQPWLTDFLFELETARNERKADGQSPKNIGYFPTWSGYYTYSNFSSILQMNWITKELQAFVPGTFDKLYAKLHPGTSDADIASFETATENLEWVDSLSLSTSLNQALLKDIALCVCDNSSSITESLYLDVPILVYLSPTAIYEPDFQDNLNFCYFFSNAQELRAHLNMIFVEKKDPLAKIRKESLNYLVDLKAMRCDQFSKDLELLSNEQVLTIAAK